MGAWGLGLFESDHDMQIVHDLGNEPLVLIDYLFRVSFCEATSPEKDEPDELFRSLQATTWVSLYGKDCYNINTMANYVQEKLAMPIIGLGSGTLMDEIIDRNTAELEGKPLRDSYGPGYRLVIAGACFMSLGCTLPPHFKQWLKQNYTDVGLMRNALTQMKKALDEGGYKDGEPWDFGSRSKDGKSPAPESNRAFPNSRLINTPAPNDSATAASIARLPQDVQDRLADEGRIHSMFANEHKNICAGCNATDKPLLLCGKCKLAKYCGTKCQTADFKTHKAFCKLFSKSKPIALFVGNRKMDPKTLIAENDRHIKAMLTGRVLYADM